MNIYRLIAFGLAAISAAAMLYVGLYQSRFVGHLICPVFAEGCEGVADAPFARPFGIPDGYIGAVLYAVMADRPVEVLITDVSMPGMDGYELAHAAIKMNEQLKVIVVTGGDTDGHGFPFVRKPFSREDLKRTMSQNTGLC